MQEQLPARPLLAAYVANLVSLPSRRVSALVTTLTTIAKITGNSISPCPIRGLTQCAISSTSTMKRRVIGKQLIGSTRALLYATLHGWRRR
ncbi:hypothetical protein M434DRAFT_393650 [Hypoxylon sp. CO27-5]|nr:hypothetical protein M434DRAFT_393650 [Hypoxylon sp. CO27-5]